MRISKTILGAIPLTLTMLLTLTACERGVKNPVATYQDLVNKAVPEHGKEAEKQEFVASEIFNIIPATTAPLTFVENEMISQEVHLQIFDERFTADLRAIKLPKGATLTKDPLFDRKWYVNWKAPAGIIPRELSTVSVDIVLAIDNITSNHPSVIKVLSTIEPSVSLKAWVRRSDEQPTLEINNFASKMIEGQPFEFDVEVSDPTSSAGNPPSIAAFFPHSQRSIDPFEEDFSSRVRLKSTTNRPKQDKDGKWRFKYVVDTKSLPPQLDKTGSKVLFESPTVAGLFALKAISTTGVPSSDIFKTFTAAYAAVKPTITLGTPLSVQRGIRNRWDFQVYTSTQRGVVSLDQARSGNNLTSLLAALGAGTDGSVTCQNEVSGPSQNCSLELFVKCGTKGSGKKNLGLVAHSVLGNVTTENSMSISLTFADSDSCSTGGN